MKSLSVFKRMAAALMAAVILMSLLPVLSFATENELFTEDFSSGLDNWTETVGTITEGVYTLPGNSLNYIKDMERETVAVSADVTVYTSPKANGFMQGTTAYVTARADKESGTGYDFGIGVNSSGQTFVRLYCRNENGVSKVLYQDIKPIDGVGTIQVGKVYNIKLATTGSTIIGLVNDVQVVEVEDPTFQSGSVGIRALDGEAKFDNIVVTDVPERRVDSIVINSHTETVSKVGKIYFDATVVYNSVFGKLPINQDSEGVVISGLDCTAGDKTVTVTYAGVSATFPIKVVDSVPANVIYETGFDDNDGTWSELADSNGYGLSVSDGYASAWAVAYPADVAMGDSMNRPVDEMKPYKSYSVEATVKILANANTATQRNGIAALTFARKAAGGTAYQLRLAGDGRISLYYGTSEVMSTNVKNILGQDFVMGRSYTLRVDRYDRIAVLYINDKKITMFGGFDGATDGYGGIAAYNGSVRFDNYKAVEIEEKGDYAIDKIYITSWDGDVLGSKSLYSPDFSNYILNVLYKDGSIVPWELTEDLLSDFNPMGEYDQVIRVTKGGKSCYMNYHYLPYLFYDDFNVFISPDWTWTSGQYIKYSHLNDRLRVEYDSTQPDPKNVNGWCGGDETWTNYSVSADVFFDQRGNINGKERFVNLIARKTGSSYYALRFVCDDIGQFVMRLCRFDKGEYNELYKISSAKLSKALELGQALGSGNVYNVRFDLVGNTLKVFFQDQLVLTYIDDSPNALFKGDAGLQIINNNCLIDNFIVKPKSVSKIVGFGLSNYPEEITLWQGNDIPAWENELVVYYDNGDVENVPLAYEMIGPYSNTELGKHSVDFTYANTTYSMDVTIMERPEYVQDVVAQLTAFADTVDSGNMAQFLEVKKLYDSLTPYEVGTLNGELIEKQKKLLHDYDVLVAPELAGQTLLTNELFNDDAEYSLWTESLEGDAGKWFVKNGMLYQAQIAYDRSTTGWRVTGDYGIMTGVSADFMKLYDMMHAGVGINVGRNGYYHARISSTTKDQDNLPVWELQLLRKNSSGHAKKVVMIVEAYDHPLQIGDWFNLTLTIEGEYVRVYLDGALMCTYQETEQMFKEGEVGLRISTGDALVDNVRVYGTLRDRQELVAPIEPSYYTDDWEDETPGENPSHWQEYRTEDTVPDHWKVFDLEGNKVYGTTMTGKTATWLHAFDTNPSFSVKFMVDEVGETGRIGFITRMAPTTAFNAIGYDIEQQKWYVASQKSLAEGPQMTWQKDTFALEAGRWYEVSVSLQRNDMVLTVDGVEVLNLVNVYHIGYGRMGFYTVDSHMFVDDYSLKMSSGDIPQDGLITYVIGENEQANFMEIEKLPDGTLFGSKSRDYLLSYDQGYTWTREGTEIFEGTATGDYPTFLKMSNGEYLNIKQGGGLVTAYVSRNMTNWVQVAELVDKEKGMDEKGHALAIIHINSATEIVLEDGTHRIFMPVAFRKYSKNGRDVLGHYTEVFYSDDFGRTWTASETTTKDIHPGYTPDNSTTWAESKIIKCADGTLRMYYPRNYLGCMQYVVSEDNGVTWGSLQQIPEIQLPMTSFGIFEDPETPGTYYMVCCNGTTSYLGSIFPRNHFMLLKTTDGMNWEFQMHVEWMNEIYSVQNSSSLYQILDPSLFIDEDYIYITIGRSEKEYSEETANVHQAQRVYYLRVEKDKLSSRPWDASTIADMFYPKTVEFAEMPQTVFGLADLFVCGGTLKLTDFLGNVTYEDISVGAIVHEEPNMFQLGKQTVHLRYMNGADLSYEIEIRPRHELLWSIEGEGIVDPKLRYITEGTTVSYNLIPAEGWKLSEVWVGEDLVETPNNQLTLSNVTETQDILVVFTELTIFDSPWFYVGVGGGVALVAAAVVIFIILGKKKKKSVDAPENPEA